MTGSRCPPTQARRSPPTCSTAGPPAALDRSVFIRARAPRCGLTAGGVTQAVAAAAGRAGLGTIYAHRLRHTAATAMLAGGGSLAEIGQVLRHRRAAHHRGVCEGEHRGAADAGAAVAGSVVVTGLREPLAGYLELRRSLGFSLEREEKLLGQFITWLEDHGAATITTADALAWVTLPAGASPGWLKFRMQAVRGFAAYLHTLDPAAEIPPPGLLPGGPRRAVPYLYSAADIAALLAQAGQLKTPLRQETLKTLIGLMAVTGMRGGEVVALDDDDFDPAAGCCWCATPSSAATGCSRCTPPPSRRCWPTGSCATGGSPAPRSQALLVSSAGTRLLYYNVGQTFARLARQAGLAARSGDCRPRPHDLRHSFAVGTLLDWCRDGADIAARMPLLSAYLGHAAPAHTYWYLQASPELLAEAARRLSPGTRSSPGDRRRRDGAGVLHRAARTPAPGQRAHHRRLPGHAAAAARLRLRARRDPARPARLRRPGRTGDQRVP